MKDNRVFIGLTVLAMVGIVAWDWVAASSEGRRETLSKKITNSSRKHLIIPFLHGFIAGHLFWSQKGKVEDNQ